MRQAIDHSTGRAWSIVSEVRDDNRWSLGFYRCPNLHDGVSKNLKDKKLTNETPHGAPPPIFSRPLVERGGDKVVAREKDDSEVAEGQTGNYKPIPIIPIAARNPAGKMTGTLPARASHPESEFRGKLRSRPIVYSETSDTYLEKIHLLQEVNRRSSCRRYPFIVCSYPQPRLGLPFLK